MSTRTNDIQTDALAPEHRTVADYFPEAPRGWPPLPVELLVDFNLSAGSTCTGTCSMPSPAIL